MGQCRYCDHKGIFVFTDSNGLCKKCRPVVTMDVQQRSRIIEDSMQLAREGKTFKTRLSCCELVLEHSKALENYESKGIPTINPPPSQIVREYSAYRDDLIIEEANKVAEKAIGKAEVATTHRGRESALASGLLKVREINCFLNDVSKGKGLESKLQELIHKAKLDGFLDAARKAEFKGQMKKAIDQYQEALYFILHDDIPDELQKGEIAEIDAKIKTLSQQL